MKEEKKAIYNIISKIGDKYKGCINSKENRIKIFNDYRNYFPITLSDFKVDFNSEESIYDLYRFFTQEHILIMLLTEHRNKIINNLDESV